MKGVKEIDIDNERIFLKKNEYLGWAVIQPYKIDGKINWKNLLIGGSWIKFAVSMAIFLLLLGAIYEHYSIVNIANECLSNSKLYNFRY